MNAERALAVVPARGGSKGIPRKNAALFLGRPLVDWTLDAARQSGVFGRILLSTDDDAIAELGRRAGVEVVERPPELAGDEVPTAPAVKHALESAGASAGCVLVLEPTAPGRRPWHVRESLGLLASTDADTVASVSRVPYHFGAEKQLRLGPGGSLSARDGRHPRELTHRRQDVPASYAFNGLVYACRTALLEREEPTLWGDRVLGYEVESIYAFDLDEPEDWAPAEARMRELLGEEAR